MLLAIGIRAPNDTNGHGRRGWLIHELISDDMGERTLYRGFFDAEGQTNAVILRSTGAYEVCSLIPVTASYYRDRKRERYPIAYDAPIPRAMA
jgi:hypothetical protein